MNDLKQIQQLIACYQNAIHSQNKDEFYKLWSQNNCCSLISITNKFIGVDRIYNDFLIERIQKKYTSINLITENMTINKINDNLAIVIFQYYTECILKETHENYGIQGLETQVLVKENHKWKLLHIHYSKR